MLLLLRTLKHLRWEQVAYRPVRMAQFRLYRRFPASARRWTSPGPAPEVGQQAATIRSVFENSFIHLKSPLESLDRRIDDLRENTFTFLNRRVTARPLDWNKRYESHLWNYQLHYFSFALWSARRSVERGDDSFEPCRRLIEGWMAGARPGRSDGWDAYPTSLRLVNWIYAYSLIEGSYQDRRFLDRWRASIHAQADFLRRHLEHHLQANHLLKNIKGVLTAGLFFDRRDWIEAGRSLLGREFGEQVLGDGGHYERSPMYHAQTLADFLECQALLEVFGHQGLESSKLRRMAGFLEAMTYPDGTFALFNDSGNTEETRPRPIIQSAHKIVGYRAGTYPSSFPQTGYFLWESAGRSEKIVVDGGPPSVDYNTAHAHCDIGSYELWLDGAPLVTDSGVHGYGGDPYREFCRSTRAHNTLILDGYEQSEIWGTFRMARRAEVLEASSRSGDGEWEFNCAYRQYRHRKVVLTRSIRRTAAGDWIVEETAGPGSPYLALSYIHLHPAFLAAKIKGDSFIIECHSEQLSVLIEPFGAAGVEIVRGREHPIQGWYFPDFGRAEQRSTIMIRRRRGCSAFGYRITKMKEMANPAK